MGQYATSGSNNRTLNTALPTGLVPGGECYVFGTVTATPGVSPAPNDTNVQFEAVTVGERSLSVALGSRPGGGAAPGISVQVNASGNPGAAEIDVQTSPVDADGAYQTPTGSAAYKITTWTGPLSDGSYTAFAELQPLADRFASLKVIANPNTVKFTGKIVYI